ncbi:MAG: two-component regulator propeller domain-containing protein [Bacteroidota bacterium]
MRSIINRIQNCLPVFFRRCIFLIFFFISFAGLSQYYQIRNFNAENGLPSPEVYGLLQDSKGYMWFATDMGVSRYNGHEFDNFSTENGLPDNTVFGFCEDAKGRIWFRSFSGKLSYFLNDSVHILPCNSILENEIRKRTIVMVSMYVDVGDTIWVGTSNRTVLKIAPGWQEKHISWITIPESGGYIFLVDDRSLLFGGNEKDAHFITVYSSQTKKLNQIETKVQSGLRYSATRLHDGSFLASVNNIILKFTKDGVLSRNEQKSTIITLLEDIDGRIISASYDGVCIHEANNLDKYEVIPGFSDKIFTGVVIDRENSLWLSTEGHGVYYIPFRNGRYYTSEHGLMQSKISCIAEYDGNIITGHLNGTASIIKKNDIKTVSFYSRNSVNVSNNRINCIYVHNNSEIYIGNNLSTFNLHSSLKDSKEYASFGAKKIIKSKGNMVWVLSARRIIRADISQGFKREKDVRFFQYIDDICEDSKGTLWIAAINGLWNYKNDTLHYLGGNNKLLSSRIINILEDKEGNLWMATRGRGVILKKHGSYYNIKQTDGLASNMCRNMLIDKNDVVWVGSNNGLSKITLKKTITVGFDVNIYSKKQGLLSNEVNFIVSRGHELLLAHNNGISIMDPKLLKNNTVPPPVYISHAEINNAIYKNDSLKLNYSENYLKINYIGLSYKDPGSVEYRYKMEGLDTTWVYTSYTSAQFQTLNPGNYKFIVYAKNNDGYWSTHPAVLYISILPAWWQTWVFRIFMGVLIVVIIFMIVKNRLDKIRKREQEKTELQNKIANTELKALRAQMNPHFIFNAINSVQYFMTNNDPESSQKYLSKFAKLIRYVMDNSKPSSIPLEKELEALKLYIDLEALRFENRFEYELRVDKEIDINYVQIPSMLIQPYIENAIWHGLMHKKGNGKLNIHIHMYGTVLTCIIEDNGIGRGRSKEIRSSESVTYHKSFGMSVTKERLEIISRLNNINPQINVIDLYENNIASGTRVEISIPSF